MIGYLTTNGLGPFKSDQHLIMPSGPPWGVRRYLSTMEYIGSFFFTSTCFSVAYFGRPLMASYGGGSSPRINGCKYVRAVAVMPKPSRVMKFFGNFFSMFAIFVSGAAWIFHLNGVFDTRLITGIIAVLPASAYSTAALPTA